MAAASRTLAGKLVPSSRIGASGRVGAQDHAAP
jgi:hypothetical protein